MFFSEIPTVSLEDQWIVYLPSTETPSADKIVVGLLAKTSHVQGPALAELLALGQLLEKIGFGL